MADQIVTYAITIAIFVLFTGIAFGIRKKRYNQEKTLGRYPGS